jgi:hypothetical protein
VECLGDVGMVQAFLWKRASHFPLLIPDMLSIGLSDVRIFPFQYSPYLRTFSTTLGTVSLARIEGSTDPAAVLVKKIWNAAIGVEEG